jgi:hypothetical protein
LFLVEKKLKHRGMEIGLKDTIAAIHGTESADMKNLVAAAGVLTGTGTGFDKGAPVSCQEKYFFTSAGRIGCISVSGNFFKYHVPVFNDFIGNVGQAVFNTLSKIAI